jgi:hypothetical protein
MVVWRVPAQAHSPPLERQIMNRLVEAYRRDPVGIGTACDEQIDRSGNLLDWLRDLSLALEAGKEVK